MLMKRGSYLSIYTKKRAEFTFGSVVFGVNFLLAGSDSSTLKGHGGDLVLGEAAITARVTVLHGDKRGAKLYETSIDSLSSGLKAKKAACGILNRSDCAIVLIVHIIVSTNYRTDVSYCLVFFQ